MCCITWFSRHLVPYIYVVALHQRKVINYQLLRCKHRILSEHGVGYSTYNYWRKKYLAAEEPHGLAPISFRKSEHHSAEPLPLGQELPSGATLLFPNGLRAHFGTGTERMLMELPEKSLVSHVLP